MAAGGDKAVSKKAVATVVAVPIDPTTERPKLLAQSSFKFKKTMKEFLFGIILSSIGALLLLSSSTEMMATTTEKFTSLFSAYSPLQLFSVNNKTPMIPIFVPQNEIEEECYAEASKEMVTTIDDGRFSYARLLALRIQQQNPHCEKTLAKIYMAHTEVFLTQKPDINWLMRIATSEKKGDTHQRVEAPEDDSDCWTGTEFNDGIDIDDASTIVLDRWDNCCSLLTLISHKKNGADSHSGTIFAGLDEVEEKCYQTSKYTFQRRRMCCSFYQGSLAHLKLPAIQELSLRLRLAPTNPPGVQPYDIVLEQDGFLRKYGTASVLWPTGYLLTLCMSDPIKCGIPEIFDAIDAAPTMLAAVEIGAGTGAPSIALSRSIHAMEESRNKNKSNAPRVLVTDRAPESLALVLANARASGAAVEVTRTSDHGNATALELFKRKNIHNHGADGFAVVLGSSLESLFDFKTNDHRHKLWSSLDRLVEPSNPNALAILAHVKGAVLPPKTHGKFELVKTISGNHFDMLTRLGDDSDFEISVYKRAKKLPELPADRTVGMF